MQFVLFGPVCRDRCLGIFIVGQVETSVPMSISGKNFELIYSIAINQKGGSSGILFRLRELMFKRKFFKIVILQIRRGSVLITVARKSRYERTLQPDKEFPRQ